jgi:Putative beta-barrel porin 2
MTAIVTIALTLISSCARAQELDSILPGSIPGYGTPFGVTGIGHPPRPEATGFQSGSLSLVPQLELSQGYDSAPNGSSGSALFSAAPSLLVTDPILGFGAFAAANVSRLPQNNAQNTSGGAVAFGERAVLPRETITIAAGYLNTQETGFALDTIAITRPIPFTMQDIRASDEITLGMFTVKPELSATRYNFQNLSAQNRTDTREGVTTSYLTGGPVQWVLRLRATQSNYSETISSADTNQALAGLVDTANGLWTFSALAGLAQRQPRNGTALTAPVLEAGLDWIPGDLDRLRLTIAHEIDDPDEVSAMPYTLTQAKLTLAHEYLNNIVLKFAAQATDASYIQSPLRETLYSSDANISWQFGARLALNGDYTFNDRQANYLRAANEHIITMGVTWTP